MRRIYYDERHVQPETSRERTQEEFLEHVGSGLHGTRTIDIKDATRIVFGVIARHVTGGQVEKVRQALPKDLQALWPDITSPPERSERTASVRS